MRRGERANWLGRRTLRCVAVGAVLFGCAGEIDPPEASPQQSGDVPAIVIRADGVLIGTCSVAALDLDSAGQLGPSDMSLWMDDFFATLCPRIDCDCSGAITAADLSFFQQRYFASFIQGCDGQRCP